MAVWEYPFDPFPKQRQALISDVDEMLWGGAIGTGKSELLLAACVDLCTLVPNAKALLVRRTFPELQELRKRLRDRIPPKVARENKSDNIFTFFNGSQLILRYLDSEDDATRLQGFELQLACVERSTPVLMGDGTWKRIDNIRAGEMVQTMEGPRRVNHSMHMGVKPVYEVTTPYGATKVAQGHRLYTQHGWAAPEELIPTGCPPAGEPYASSPETCQEEATPHECLQQGPQPVRGRPQQHLAGNPHRAKCACSGAHRSGSATSDDGTPAGRQLQAWSVPLVLTAPPRPKSPSGGGDACASGASGALGCASCCPTSPRSCGERGTGAPSVGAHPSCTPSQGDAAPSSQLDQRMGDQTLSHAHNPVGLDGYVHPYTNESRLVNQPLAFCSGRMAPAGEAEVWDLEVEGANHYVTWGHLTMSNCFDELTHYTQESYALVISRLRATGQVKHDMDRLGFKLRALAASNPGGRGHAWVKDRFIDCAPPGEPFTGEDGTRRLFLPASIYDNPYLDHEDYIRRLGGLDPERKRALIEGDWSIPAGTRFPQFRERVHVIKPEDFPIPVVGAVRCVGVDYGINDPFAAVWAAKVGDTIVVYRDHVQDGLAASQQAEKVLELESEEERLHSDVTVALDPNGWARNPHFGGMKLSPGADEAPLGSIAYNFREALGDRVVKGWNPRVQGWAIFDELMVERDTGMIGEDGTPVKLPRILIYDTCRELIRFMSSAPRDKRNPDSVDTTWKHDHVGDAARYCLAELLGLSYRSKLPAHERDRLEAGNRTLTAGVQSASF